MGLIVEPFVARVRCLSNILRLVGDSVCLMPKFSGFICQRLRRPSVSYPGHI